MELKKPENKFDLYLVEISNRDISFWRRNFKQIPILVNCVFHLLIERTKNGYIWPNILVIWYVSLEYSSKNKEFQVKIHN